MSRLAFERDDSLWRAAGIVRARIRLMPEYSEGLCLVTARVVEICRGKSVAEMRQLGGFTAVALEVIRSLPEFYHANRGSLLFPLTVADLLREARGDIRENVQFTLAAEFAQSRCGVSQ